MNKQQPTNANMSSLQKCLPKEQLNIIHLCDDLFSQNVLSSLMVALEAPRSCEHYSTVFTFLLWTHACAASLQYQNRIR